MRRNYSAGKRHLYSDGVGIGGVRSDVTVRRLVRCISCDNQAILTTLHPC